MWTTAWAGAYPRIHDRGIPPDRWLADYVATYVERDVRPLLQVADLTAFGQFLRLRAGRTGQEINLSNLGADAGVSRNTARSWLSVLEASFHVFRLPAWHRNSRKQIIKAPKLGFIDTGLVCHLLGITAPDQLVTHPPRGPIFETWVASERSRARAHAGLRDGLGHHRQTRRLEIDLVETHPTPRAFEVKSDATVTRNHTRHLRKLGEEDPSLAPLLVHAGAARGPRHGAHLLP